MKKTSIILLTVSLLIFAGCFDYEETMIIDKDLSGTVEIKYSMDKEYLKQLESMLKMLGEAMGESKTEVNSDEVMFSKSKIEDALKSRNAGIKLLSYSTSETDSVKVWNMQFSFQTIDSLKALADAISMQVGTVAGQYDSGPVYSKQADGTWLFARPLSGNMAGNESEAAGDSANVQANQQSGSTGERFPGKDTSMTASNPDSQELPEDVQRMVDSMKNDKIRITVKFPGRIIESNATSTDGSSATWEYTLEQMQTAPQEMRAVIK